MPTIRFLREGLDVPCANGAILRDVALGAKVELYGLKGKLGNCGGCGQCSTCFVAVAHRDGPHDLAPRTPTEERFLKKHPSSWRLACQTVIRGSVVVATQPQRGRVGDQAALEAALAQPWPQAEATEQAEVQEGVQAEASDTESGDITAVDAAPST